MKKINALLFKITLVAILSVGLQNCISLEEDTSSILQLENLTDEGAIIASLTPIYRQFQDLVKTPQNHHPTAYGADDITTWWAGNKAPLRVFDRFDYGDGQNSDILWLDIAWNYYWRIIYYCNSLIEGLKSSTAPENIVKTADAEARFFRAIAYFDLVKRWGNMPKILDGMVPTGEETRATVLENYQHIEADLKIAETNLPNPGATANIGRVSKAAAKALFAEFYITWAGWPVKDASKYALAAQKAKDIISMNYFTLLPIDKLWLQENQNSMEAVFAVQFSEVEDFRNIYPTSTSFHMAGGWSDIYPERQFFYDFPEGPRKIATYATDIPNMRVVGGILVPGSPPTRPWLSSERKHPMFAKFLPAAVYNKNNKTFSYRALEIYRYAEVLLTFAEASARASGGIANTEALNALNQVRRRAMGLPYNTPNASVDLTSANADQILAEKGWELTGEIAKRWWDLVRTEKLAEAIAHRDPTEEVPLVISASQINWKHYIAPIPYQAISTSKLEQNPSGFKIQ